MPTLDPGDVHIWRARFACGAASSGEAALSDPERAEASRFRFARHRDAYVFAHNVLRSVLSRYLNRDAANIRFQENSFGKPFLALRTGEPPLAFNMSHAGAFVVIAVSSGRQLGVDVEEVRPLPEFQTIAATYFTPQECGFIFDHVPEKQERAFFRCWTRKEAYVKAVGKGLSIPLNSFDTHIAHGQPGRTVSGIPDAGLWWLTDLDMPEGYLGALAIEQGIQRIACFDWKE